MSFTCLFLLSHGSAIFCEDDESQVENGANVTSKKFSGEKNNFDSLSVELRIADNEFVNFAESLVFQMKYF